MATVLITTSSFGVYDMAPIRKLKAAGYDVVVNPYGRKLTEDELIGLIEEYSPVGVLAGVEPFTEKAMNAAQDLKVISRCGIGLDSVDCIAAKNKGIVVTNTPDAPTAAVAEVTVGAMLSSLRGLHTSHKQICCGEWCRPFGNLLSHQTVGLMGMGRIGSYVASLLAPFGCSLIACDPYAEMPATIRSVSFEELCSQSDILSLHLPYSSATHHIIDEKSLQLMKPSAYLINYSRGGLINEAALCSALQENRLRGAALDCFEKEPYVGELTTIENVLLTGHIGSYAKEGRIIQETQTVDNFLQSV